MKKSLMYSLPVLLTAACSEPAETELNNIHCVLHPQEEALQPYYNLLVENPALIEAMGFCEKPTSIQEIMWDKIKEAKKTGLLPTAPKPQSYYDFGLGMETKSLSGVSFQNDNSYQKIEMLIENAEYDFYFPTTDKEGRKLVITNQIFGRAVESFLLSENKKEPITYLYATKEEAHEIYAAQLAASLWKEQHKIFPWSIVDYTPEQAGELYQTKTRFSRWDEKNDEYMVSLVLDNSPRETWEELTKIVDVENLPDQKTALIDITTFLRSFRHGRIVYDSEGNLIEEDPKDIITNSSMSKEGIARKGCQSIGIYNVQEANALNIPGEFFNGYFNGEGHRSVKFELTDQVLAHGDDVYDAYLNNTPSSELMDRYTYWKENVLAYPKGEEPGVHNSWVHIKKNEMKFPAWNLLRDYCGEGRLSLEQRFRDFASEEEMDELEQKIKGITNGCMNFPENNPDQ